MDRRALEQELATALEREESRRTVDEMKKRAIVSAGSYEEFKNLVACAGLKPLGRQDLANKADVPANRMMRLGATAASIPLGGIAGPDSAAAGSAATQGTQHEYGAVRVQQRPRTAAEFDAAWRRFDASSPASERIRFLGTLDLATVPALFRVDLDGEMLASVIHAVDDEAAAAADCCGAAATGPSSASASAAVDCDEGSSAAAVRVGASFLVAVSRAEAFDFAKAFLQKEDTDAVRRVVAALTVQGAAEQARSLEQAYLS